MLNVIEEFITVGHNFNKFRGADDTVLIAEQESKEQISEWVLQIYKKKKMCVRQGLTVLIIPILWGNTESFKHHTRNI